MYSYADISSYYRKYCSYYQTLEADFVATERYLTIDEDNFLLSQMNISSSSKLFVVRLTLWPNIYVNALTLIFLEVHFLNIANAF